MITIRYYLIGFLLFFLFAFTAGQMVINLTEVYNNTGLSNSLTDSQMTFLNEMNASIIRGQSSGVSISDVGESAEAAISEDQGINLLKTGLEVGKLLLNIPDITLTALNNIASYLGLPNWLVSMLITLVLFTIIFSLLAALLTWYI